MANCGVIIATNQTTPKSVVGSYMVNRQIKKANKGNKWSPKGFQYTIDTDQSIQKEYVGSVIPSFTKEQLEQL